MHACVCTYIHILWDIMTKLRSIKLDDKIIYKKKFSRKKCGTKRNVSYFLRNLEMNF